MPTIYYTDGTKKELDHVPSYEEAKEIIGGYVERVCPRASPNIVFLCDEEGLLKRLPWNEEGQKLYGHTSDIVGTIIVMTRREAKSGEWL